jgi:3-oxoadipate enol-lactonase
MAIVYDDAGTGGTPVALVHGWGFGNPSHLLPQFDHFASRRRVLKFDLPGQGRSDQPPLGFGFKDCAAAIVAELDAAGVDQVIVCGHSFGGRLAAEVAADFPSRVAGIGLLDPVILFPELVRQQAPTGLVPALETENRRKAVEAYFSRLLSPYDPPEARSRVMAELDQISPRMAASLMREGMTTDGAELLARIHCPMVVVIAGAP